MREGKSSDRVEIRKAVPGDVQKIAACAREAYFKYVERIGREPPPMVADFYKQTDQGLVYVACINSDLCGYAIFYPRGTSMHLENLAVDPLYQGHGLGGKLIAFVEDKAKECGCVSVELYTNVNMHENIPWYKKRGYVITGRKTEFGLERIYFKKFL